MERVVRGSYHDGPGMRTVVFLKGCGLRCIFCHSPQTQDPRPELAFYPVQCLGCGACVAACPTGARQDPATIHRARCRRCFACVRSCPSGALRQVGQLLSPAALAAQLARDRPFFRASGGGVTLSGGEPLLWPDYLAAVLDALNPPGRHPVHVVVETGGHFSWRRAEPVLRRVDAVLYDLKLADESAHHHLLGRSGRRVRENLARLAAWAGGPRLQVRVPVVPSVTDSEANLRAVLRLAREAGAQGVHPLPYNPAGLDGYAPLGRRTPALFPHFQTAEAWQAFRARFARWHAEIFGNEGLYGQEDVS